MNFEIFVLVFIGMTSVFVPESCQGDDTMWSAWWRWKQKTWWSKRWSLIALSFAYTSLCTFCMSQCLHSCWVRQEDTCGIMYYSACLHKCDQKWERDLHQNAQTCTLWGSAVIFSAFQRYCGLTFLTFNILLYYSVNQYTDFVCLRTLQVCKTCGVCFSTMHCMNVLLKNVVML